MKPIFFLSCLVFLMSCDDDNFNTVSNIINGNTIVLENGVTVQLIGVSNTMQNLPVLRRYLSGPVILMDDHHNVIEDFTGDHVSALVYDQDGDQVNKLLTKAAEITDRPLAKTPENKDRTVVSITRENGVLKMPVEINGVSLYLIFDTGASLVSLSANEADIFYGNHTITSADFIGKSNFTDANGGVREGTIVNLRTVKIGDRLLQDVQAVINSSQEAPLLFGESAMQKFGKVSIDYNRNEITFE